MVKVPTRGEKTLDVFMTSSPHLWKAPTALKVIIRSVRLAILIHLRNTVEPMRKTVYFRDVKEHKLKERDGSNFDTCQNSSERVVLLNDTLWSKVSFCDACRLL